MKTNLLKWEFLSLFAILLQLYKKLQNGCDSETNTSVKVILEVFTVLLLEEVYF